MTIQKPVWEDEGANRARRVSSLFGDVAASYDQVNRWMTFNQDSAWRAQLVSEMEIKTGARVLDCCCGTGMFFSHLVNAVGPTGQVTGADFCVPMLELAPSYPNVKLVVADAHKLPFESGSFNAITIGWGLRNLIDVSLGLKELYRILAPGGKIGIIECVDPAAGFQRFVSAPVRRWGLPALGALRGTSKAYAYLGHSIKQFGTSAELVARLSTTGFQQIRSTPKALGNNSLVWASKP